MDEEAKREKVDKEKKEDQKSGLRVEKENEGSVHTSAPQERFFEGLGRKLN